MSNFHLLHHLLENTAAEVPSKEAVVDLVGPRRSLDYLALHAMASNCASVMQEQGIERRDRVAIYLSKSAEEAAAIFAPSLADGVFVSVNGLLLGHQVAHILADCGVKYLITSRKDWKRVREEVGKVESLRGLLFVDGNDDFSEQIPTVFEVMQKSGKTLHASTSIGQDL